MDQRKFAARVYVVLLLISVFVLGYFAGAGQTELQITVSAVPEVPEAEIIQAETETQKPEGPIDLNTAQEADLETLPGIGPGLAARIVEYRNQVGRFVTVEQLMDVEGIGEKRFEEIKNLITVGGG